MTFEAVAMAGYFHGYSRMLDKIGKIMKGRYEE